MTITAIETPLAITMWDFSWLERRYPGGGYADWERALTELTERGYDAVRIDAYPHLVSRAPSASGRSRRRSRPVTGELHRSVAFGSNRHSPSSS